MLTAVYGDHPYARTQATEESINAVTRDKLQQAYKQRVRPDQALLVITGRIEPDAAFKLAQEAFGELERRRRSAQGHHSIARRSQAQLHSPARAARAIERAHREPGNSGDPRRLCAAAPDQHALLGGGFSSRLMQNLREDKGYTYGAGVGYRGQASGGALVASADVRNEVTGKAVGEFFAEYQRIGAEPVSAAELDMNKRYVAGGYLISNQLQGAVAGTLANNWLVGLPPEFLGEFVPENPRSGCQASPGDGQEVLRPEGAVDRGRR